MIFINDVILHILSISLIANNFSEFNKWFAIVLTKVSRTIPKIVAKNVNFKLKIKVPSKMSREIRIKGKITRKEIEIAEYELLAFTETHIPDQAASIE